MIKNDFHSAMFQANLLYGVDITEDLFEEIGLIGYEMIGNKNMKLYHTVAEIKPEILSIELPCNCEYLESVTYPFEDWNYTTNHTNFGDINSAYVEHYVEGLKFFTDPLYHRGKFAEYEQVGNILYFKHPGVVHILYRGLELDDNGLPYLNEKEKDAIAVYVAYVTYYKEGLKNKNGDLLKLAADLRALWNIKVDLARSPEYINQNEMNEVLEAKTSWNRKVHNKSFKPIV